MRLKNWSDVMTIREAFKIGLREACSRGSVLNLFMIAACIAGPNIYKHNLRALAGVAMAVILWPLLSASFMASRVYRGRHPRTGKKLPIADLDRLSSMKGFSEFDGPVITGATGRKVYRTRLFERTLRAEEETYRLEGMAAAWDLKRTFDEKHIPRTGRETEVVASKLDLENAVTMTRARCEELRAKYDKPWGNLKNFALGTFSGGWVECLYIEPDSEIGLASVERALEKKRNAPAPSCDRA